MFALKSTDACLDCFRSWGPRLAESKRILVPNVCRAKTNIQVSMSHVFQNLFIESLIGDGKVKIRLQENEGPLDDSG